METSLRPYIICYMESSIDGRLRIERYSKSFYDLQDDYIISEYLKIGSNELKGEAMLFGRTTYYQDFYQKLYDIDSHKVPASKFEPYKGKKLQKAFIQLL